MKPVVRIERADSDELFRAKVNQNFLTVAKDTAQDTDSLAVAAIVVPIVNGALSTEVPSMVSDELDTAMPGIVSSAVDGVGATLVDTASVNLTYDDSVPSIKADVVFGSTSTTVAAGNHTHAGVYQPAGSYSLTTHDHDGGDGATIPPEGIRYYVSSSSSSGYSGQYTRLGTVSLAVRYAEYTQEIAVIGGDGGTPLRGCHVRWRVRQQNAMGGAPIVEIVVRDCRGITPAQFVAVTTTNSSSETVVSLYFQPSTTYQYVVFRPLVRYLRDSATQVWWYDDQGFSASLPSGTQTIGHDGMSHVKANRSSAQTIASATGTTVVFSTEVTDTLGEYNPSTGVFTASEAGWYSVRAQAVLGSTSWTAGQFRRTYLRINAADDYRTDKYAEATTSHYTGVGWDVPMLWLAAGDTLALRIYHTRGADCALCADATANWLKIDRIN